MSETEITWVFITSVAIGALVGGMTNFLAIRMLFRPFHRWYIGKWTVPFTPGLIPKRRDELARQLGRLVEQYLFTPEGMKRLLEEGRISQQLSAYLSRRLAQAADSGWTVEELVTTVANWLHLPHEVTECNTWLTQVERWAVRFLKKYSDTPLSQLLGARGTERFHRYLPFLTHYLLEQTADYLNSVSGRRLIKRTLQEVLSGAARSNRMLGALANLFVDEERLLTWILPKLQEWLRQGDVQTALEQWLRVQVDALGERTLREWQQVFMEMVKEEETDLCGSLAGRFSRLLALKLQDWREMSFQDLLEPVREPLFSRWLPEVTKRLEAGLANNLKSLFGFFHVSEVVEREVLGFPLPYLERVILEVASREFRMITWLGALIGALVGLIQGVWLIFWTS